MGNKTVLGWDSLPHHCRNFSNRICNYLIRGFTCAGSRQMAQNHTNLHRRTLNLSRVQLSPNNSFCNISCRLVSKQVCPARLGAGEAGTGPVTGPCLSVVISLSTGDTMKWTWKTSKAFPAYLWMVGWLNDIIFENLVNRPGVAGVVL